MRFLTDFDNTGYILVLGTYIPQQDASSMILPWCRLTLLHYQQDWPFPVWVNMLVYLNWHAIYPESKANSLSPWSQRCCWLGELEWPSLGIFPASLEKASGLVKLARSSPCQEPWWWRANKFWTSMQVRKPRVPKTAESKSFETIIWVFLKRYIRYNINVK